MKHMRGKGVFGASMLGLLALGLLSGCSRATLNYQLAESLGTLGQYENNEPVETPKMKADREAREESEAKEKEIQTVLDAAAALAGRGDYDSALAKLGEISEADAQNDQVVTAKTMYQSALDAMSPYEGEVAQLDFASLIVDTARAFDGDEMASTYASNNVTVTEFEQILQSLYNNGYVLADIHEFVTETTDEEGKTVLTRSNPSVPSGKTPFVLYLENLNYQAFGATDGFAKALTLDENGEVKAVYVDGGGHESVGDYDVIPIVDAFVEQHPDFSLRGAKGVISLSGYRGIFGYETHDPESYKYAENLELAKQIAEQLKATGWQFASNSYGRDMMTNLTAEALAEDTQKWKDEVGAIVGETDIILCPYGAVPSDGSQQLAGLIEDGFRFILGMWQDEDHMTVNNDYVYLTRRFVDGDTLVGGGSSFTQFFNVNDVIDPVRTGGTSGGSAAGDDGTANDNGTGDNGTTDGGETGDDGAADGNGTGGDGDSNGAGTGNDGEETAGA